MKTILVIGALALCSAVSAQQQPTTTTLKKDSVAPSKTLDKVTVTARKPVIEQKIDRTVMNVGASVTNIGTNALEVLEKAPGVTIDKEGNISLKGKDGVMVLIDGRPTHLSGADLGNLLRSMQSSQLDVIEIMTNPPARYDADGNAGIINIKTKKNNIEGYNGSANLDYSQSRYPRINEGFNLNYRKNKISITSNLSHNYRQAFKTLTIQRNIRDANTKELQKYFAQESNMIREANAYNARIAMDYFASRKTTLGVGFSLVNSDFTTNNFTVNNISSPTKQLEAINTATSHEKGKWKNFSPNLNFRTVFDSTGKELSADFNYINYNSKNNQFLVNAYFDADMQSTNNADTILSALPQHIQVYSGRIDYLHPLSKTSNFEAGFKTSIVKTDNNANYDSIQNGNLVHDLYRSNYFVYRENVNAAYVNYKTSLSKKWNAQLGLRLENTNANGVQITTGEEFNRHYTQLFPTAYLQYKANAKNNFGLNYGRRVRRPNYESLNPFIRFIDRYTYSQGNSNLEPQLSDNIEFTHIYGSFLTTTLNYSYTKNIIQQVIEQKGDETYAMPANIATMNQVGVSVSINKNMNKWWMNNLTVNVYNNNFKGLVNNEQVRTSQTTLLLTTIQQFKLSKTVTAELNGIYRSAGVQGVMQVAARGMLNAGLSKQVMKSKGTLRLNVRDIFYTAKSVASIKYGNVDAGIQELNDTRMIIIGFSYRFSKGKVGQQKKKAINSANEEQERIDMQ